MVRIGSRNPRRVSANPSAHIFYRESRSSTAAAVSAPAAADAGFTLLELLVIIGLTGLVFSMGVTNASTMFGQLRASSGIRRLALDIERARSEAIRLRTNVRVDFSAGGYTVDIDDDGHVDFSEQLHSQSSWSPAAPAAFAFNGIGLARGIGSTTTISIDCNGVKSSLVLNSNGYVKM